MLFKHRASSGGNAPELGYGASRTSYYWTDRAYRGPVRKRVVEHLLSAHPDGPVDLLCLPGVGWPGERLLARRTARMGYPVTATGLERLDLVYDKVVETKPRWASAVNASASGYLPGTPDRVFTAVWLDFTSTLSDEILQSVRRLPKWLAGGPVPFAFTFLASRDKDGYAKEWVARGSADLSAVARRAEVLADVVRAHRPIRPEVRVFGYRVTSIIGVVLGVYEPT